MTNRTGVGWIAMIARVLLAAAVATGAAGLGNAQEPAAEALGPDHPDTARGMNNLATLLQADPAAALPLLERARQANRRAMHAPLPVQSPRERCAMLQERSFQLACYLSAFAAEAGRTYATARFYDTLWAHEDGDPAEALRAARLALLADDRNTGRSVPGAGARGCW